MVEPDHLFFGKDAPERRLIVAPTCQSEIKRTLRSVRAVAADGISTALSDAIAALNRCRW